MKAALSAFALIALAFNLAACGDSNGLDLGPDGQRLQGATIDCNGESCNPSTQYCMISKFNGNILAAHCLSYPSAGRDCVSIQADAGKHDSKCDFKSGSTDAHCTQHNGTTVMTCGS